MVPHSGEVSKNLPLGIWKKLNMWICHRLPVSQSCRCIARFWAEVTALISKLTGFDLFANPAACLLHLTPMKWSKYKKSLTIHLLNAAKAYIPSMWKSPTPPMITQWISRVKDIMPMEDLTASLKGTVRVFKKTCYCWQQFWESQDYPPLLT